MLLLKIENKMKNLYAVALTFAFLVISARAYSTEIYKSIDENGNVSFSEYPINSASKRLEFRSERLAKRSKRVVRRAVEDDDLDDEAFAENRNIHKIR